jgi:hypothetical protein
VSRASTRQTVLWAAVMLSVFAAVLTISMLPPKGGTPAREPAAVQEPGPTAPVAAANPWAQFATPTHFTVRAEDFAAMHGAMLTGTGPDNEGVMGKDGRPATVRYVWCPDDGLAEADREKEDEAAADTSGDHWAEFDMDVPAVGTYYPWARVWWEDGCGDSIVVAWGRDQAQVAEFAVQDGTQKSWHWLPVAGPAGVKLQKGAYRLVVRNREDGARLSRIFFSGKPYESYKPETPEG